MRKIPVAAGGYDICLQAGLLDHLESLGSVLTGGQAAIVADSNTAPLFGVRVQAGLTKLGIASRIITVPAGEASKCHAQLLALYDAFLDMRLTRSDWVIALGGGVVGDLAGYAAATYLRGAKLLQVPTTLLAQVDSSVGGKVGVNLPRGKNLVGAFYWPQLVVIDPDTLATLDQRQLGAGLGEAIKYGCIADAALFAKLENAGSRAALGPLLPEIIARCCESKADYTSRDPLDHGVRMELNFGHTLGHALENGLGYGQMLHGEAVCVGMLAAARWGEKLGVTEPGTAARLRRLLTALELPTSAPAVAQETLLSAMVLDKKGDKDGVAVVLLEKIGQATLRRVPRAELAGLVAEGMPCA